MSDAQQADTPLSQKVQDLDRQISAKVEALVKGVHSQIGERVRAATDDVVRWIEENAPEFPQSLLIESDLTGLLSPSGQDQAEKVSPAMGYRPLLEAVSRIDAETGQAEILGSLLEESLRFCSRSAFFLLRQGQVRCWAGKGFGEADQRIGEIEEKADQDPWSVVVEKNSSMVCSDEQLAGMAIRMNVSPGQAAAVLPFSIRGQIAGVLYADQLEDGNPISISGLQLLVHTAAMALETAAVSPGTSPCLKLEGQLPEPGESATGPKVADDEPTGPSEALEEPVAVVEPAKVAPVEDVEPEVEISPEPEVVAADTTLDEEPATADFVAADESLSKEDLETTVVPAISEEPDSGDSEAQAAEEYRAVEEPPGLEGFSADEDRGVSEPTVEIDAPALSLSSATETSAAETAATPAWEVNSEPAYSVPPVVSLPEPIAPEAPRVESFEPPQVEEPAAPDFGSVSPPSEEEIALEAEPEPELEDTNAWELEAEEEDDEPTQVGMAVKVEPPTADETPSPPALEISADEESVPSPISPDLELDGMPVGQETVRLPIVTPQATPADEATDPGDATSPALQIETPAVESAQPAPPPAPTSFADPPPAPLSFADPPPAPTSFADPPPPVAPAAPTSFADPVPAAPPVAPATFSPPAVEKPAEVKSSGSSEVRPPSDLEGPGLAFAMPQAAAVQPDAAGEALHEEARRLARLLVSEIKLYNEDIIEEGRRTGNIYERLKDDIDRSRQMYEERIDPRLADQEDYFYQELIQRLAGGDASLLGM